MPIDRQAKSRAYSLTLKYVDIDSGMHTGISERNSASMSHLNTSSGVSSYHDEIILLNPN